MTIAACYLSSEGVVFGADSTSTMFVPGPGPDGTGADHYYNYAQKVFEVGENGRFGIALWGLGSLAPTSYRTLIARFAEQLSGLPPEPMVDLANRWNLLFWEVYSREFAQVLEQTQQLIANQGRTPEEEQQLQFYMQTFSGGFCLGGCCPPDGNPEAYEITFSPGEAGPTQPEALSIGSAKFWGCPNMIYRLIYGVDFGILEAIENSGRWTGTPDDLIALVLPFRLAQPLDLPIREAIDWVYTSIYTTSQALKFSHLAPVCGGPVELAVITTDRPFRWVRHKKLDAAISQNGWSDE